MASDGEIRRLRFVQAYNTAIAPKTGRPLQFKTDQQLATQINPLSAEKAAIMLAKKVKPPTVKKTTAAAATGPASAAQLLAALGKGGGSNKAVGSVTSSGGIGGGKPIKLDLSALQGGTSYGGLKSLWKKVDQAVTNNPVTDALQNNPVTRVAAHALPAALDVVSRPAYAVDEGLRRLGESADQNGSILGDVTSFLHGTVAGATGKKKTGFGNVIDRPPALGETNAYTDKLIKEGKLTVAQRDKIMSDWKNRKQSGLEVWGKRALGLAGDILTDPTTYLSGGTEVLAKDAVEAGGRSLAKASVAGTLDLGKDALKNQVGRIVKGVVDENKHLRDVKTIRKGSNVPRTLSEHITQQVGDKIDKVVYDMHKGGMIGGGLNDMGTVAHDISEQVRTTLMEQVRKKSDAYVAALKKGKRFSDAERAAMKAKDPLFGQWLDSASKLSKSGKWTPQQVFEKAHVEFSKQLEPDIAAIAATAENQLKDSLLNVPTVKFMGKKLYLPKLGEAGQAVGKRAAESPALANFNKAMRYSSWFPGYTTHISQKLKSMNVQEYDAFKSDLENLLKDTTKAQRVNIHRAIQEGIDLPGRDGEIQRTIRQQYQDLWKKEIGAGARSKATSPYVPNYAYNQIKGTGRLHPDFLQNWKLNKKEQARLHKNIEGFTSKDAIAQGKKVEEDVGQALLARKAKSIRELSRINFKKDLIEHYGIRSSIDPRLAEKAGMHLVDKKRYDFLYKDLKPGENLYLHKNIEDVYNNYNKMVQYGQNSANDVVTRGLDQVTKLFKTANTIYWPGFHLRNAASDFLMGIFDGVKTHQYGQIMNAMTHKDTAFLKVGGERVPFRTLHKSYLDNAATAGFFDSEMKHSLNPADLSTTKYMDSTIKGGIKNVNSKFRNLSQHREDFGRFVHYYHAMNEEYGAQLAKGVKPDVAWKNAEEAAIARVNKFKFDYNALTPKEQAIRRFGMPFYTYMRKATPVLLENMLMHPKYFSYMNRMQNALAPSQDFVGAGLPSRFRDMAYSELSSSNHIGFTDALLPTRTLKETFSNPITRSNPILQGLIEMQTHKDLFSGKPVGTGVQGLTDILKNKWRGISTFRSIESDTKPSVEKWAGLFGIPLVQITPGRQGQRLREIEQQVTDKSTALDKKLLSKGLKVRVTKGKVYLIQPKSPTADELAHNMKPKYPENKKEKVLGVYNSFNDLPFKV